MYSKVRSEEKCLGEFARYTSLNVLGMIGLSCYILADTFFVSKGLGTNGLAALNLAIPIYSFIHGCGLMLGIGGATRYSISRGQKAEQAGNEIFSHVVWSTLALAVIFMAVGLLFSENITGLLGANAQTEEMTNTYIKVVLLFSPAFMMNDVLISFVRNDGNPGLSMTAMLTGSFSNIILDYIFIFPMQMGIFGAVFATGLAPVISMAVLSVHFLKKQNHFSMKKVQLRPRIVGTAVSLGFPSLVAEVSSGLVIIIFNILMLRLEGNTGVAAYGVIANLSLVAIAVYTGLAQGMQPICSEAYGLGKKEKIRHILWYGIVTELLIAAIIYLLMFFFADQVAAVFNSENDRRLQMIAVEGIRLYFTALPFAGFNIVISTYFTSTERAVPAHIVSLLRGIVLIVPMAFFMAYVWKITGVWLAFPMTEAMVCLIGMGIFRAKR